MDTADGEKVMGNLRDQKLQQLNEVFGALRAEYIGDELYDLFTQPNYFPELLSKRPCILVGGRGTGKTTVLNGLSYVGQSKLSGDDVSAWRHIGIYWKVDTGVARSFRGPEVSIDRWTKIFSHYLNLVLCQHVLDFLAWDATQRESIHIAEQRIRKVCVSLGLEVSANWRDLRIQVEESMLDLESSVNNIDTVALPRLSMLGRPIQYLLECLDSTVRFQNKTIYFLVDEYENLEDYQQQVVNTMVKHCSDYNYSFKIGVRELGHRERSTINPNETLNDPADYALIEIASRLDETHFLEFSRKVCDSRLERISQLFDTTPSVDSLFPAMSAEAEAVRLGVEEHIPAIRQQLLTEGTSLQDIAEFDQMSFLSAYLVSYWAESKNRTVSSVLKEALGQTSSWSVRLTNYQYAMLYTIRRRKRGYKKYYSGWTTFNKLAAGNIRYLLQLTHTALEQELRRTDGQFSSDLSAELQTSAATIVGSRAVEQLQGASANSADLTRLVLGLGRIFQIMAAQPYGHAPEVSQFHLADDPSPQLRLILDSAVMHLAVRRFATDKMAAISGQIRDYSFQLHPIFAPFFVYSYRNKRRAEFTSDELLAVIMQPKSAIPEVLKNSGRDERGELPPQLSLFKEYYDFDN